MTLLPQGLGDIKNYHARPNDWPRVESKKVGLEKAAPYNQYYYLFLDKLVSNWTIDWLSFVSTLA